MDDKKTIIVTGGAGFIGSNFVYYMLPLALYIDVDMIHFDSWMYF